MDNVQFGKYSNIYSGRKMDKNDAKEVCNAAIQIQNILDRKNLELALWPNVKGEQCVWVIKKGESPWTGARVATLKK